MSVEEIRKPLRAPEGRNVKGLKAKANISLLWSFDSCMADVAINILLLRS